MVKRKTADGKMVMMRVDNKGDAVMVKEEEQDGDGDRLVMLKRSFFSCWGRPVPYLELFWVGPVKKTTP